MESKSYRVPLIVTLITIVILLAVTGAFVYIVDPYQQYRAHQRYLGNQRLEIAGVARNHDYNAFITGSSMAMNHYPSLADSLWGWKTKNFSIMGATDDDYGVIIPFIIDRKKAESIIWGIDFFSFARQRGAVDKYLYDDNLYNDYEYLWNYTSLKNSVQFLKSSVPDSSLYHFNSPVGRNKLNQSFDKTIGIGYPEENFDLEIMKRRFDSSVYNVIAGAPDSIKWYIYFPPYSIGEFIIYDIHGNLDANLAFKRYIISRLSELPNVEVYDFQIAPWIINLDEYMDLRHHSHKFNREIIKAIHGRQYKATDSGYTDEIKKLVKQYRDSLGSD